MSENEQPNPYGARVVVPDAAAPGAVPPPRRVRIHHLREMKQRGEKFAMLTAYDQYAAAVFEQAGIPVLLVGDSAANNVYGYETTVPITVDEMVPLVRAVTRSARHCLVVARGCRIPASRRATVAAQRLRTRRRPSGATSSPIRSSRRSSTWRMRKCCDGLVWTCSSRWNWLACGRQRRRSGE